MTSGSDEHLLDEIEAELESQAYVVVSLPLSAGPADRFAQDLAPWLSAEDHRRSAEMSSPRTAAAFVVTRALLRRILGHVLDAPPRALEFAVGHKGKPSLARPPNVPVHFNVSHCRTHALIGLSRVGDLGVDVESVGEFRDAVARRSTSDSEYAALQRFPETDRPEAFIRLWTIKEACAKATGHGIGVGMRNVSASFEPHGRWQDFLWASLELPPGHAGAIAVRAPAEWFPMQGVLHETTIESFTRVHP